MKQMRAGLGYGLGAYLIWGAFPAFFTLIAAVNPLEVVPWRVSATLVFAAILVTALRRWPQVTAILRAPRSLGWFALSGVLLYINWQLFIVGVITGHIIETALGYFMNPLVTILIGVIVRKERLTRLQWAAVAIAGAGVLVAAVAYGDIPWISIGLAISFGLYGAVHKHVGESVDGLTGLTVETLVTTPIGIVQILILGSVVGIDAFSHGPVVATLVFLSGVATAIPLILFGEAARRLPLSYLGFLQFLTPIMGFLYGYFVTGEQMDAGRWIGFIAVWIALVLLIIEMVRHVRRRPEEPPNTAPIPLD